MDIFTKCYLCFYLASVYCFAKGFCAATKPHVIFILADDLGWNDVSFHGSRQIPTPNLDTLAYDGIILANYYVQPICTPTRGALMTGKYPIHIGLQHSVLHSSEPWGLPLNETIMPQYFREMGYRTHMVGKWHLGFFAKEYTPTYRGFETHLGYYEGAEDYWDHTSCVGCKGTEKSGIWGYDFHKNGEVYKPAFGQYSTELFTKEAENIIKDHNTSEPLFLYLPFQAVHSAQGSDLTPLEAPWKYLKNFGYIKNDQRRIFAAMVSALDDAVGNITKSLKDSGMLENSIIVFSTDNGGPANGYNRNMASNWPLRGVKESLWEGGMRGSSFLWSPLLEKSQFVAKQFMQVEDWLPTLLTVCGYDMSKLPSSLDGLDQWTILSTNGKGERTEIFHNIDPELEAWALRIENMKLIFGKGGPTFSWQDWYPIPTTNDVYDNETNTEQAPDHMFESDLVDILKSIGRNPPKQEKPYVVSCPLIPPDAHKNCIVNKKPCLYDLDADPCEFHNLANEMPDAVKHLLDRLDYYNRTAVPIRNLSEDPKGYPSEHGGMWVPWVQL